MKELNRRQWMGALAAGAAAWAQAPAEKPETAEELLKAAEAEVRHSVETLSKTKVPMAIEPAFAFKA
jgi:hypothetical protein